MSAEHSWARTPRILRARGGVYYIKFVRYCNRIRRLGGGGFNPDPLRAQVCCGTQDLKQGD